LLFACLIAGMTASVIGMALRWISHRRDQREKQSLERKLDACVAQKPIA
jgi:hypothetical protein